MRPGPSAELAVLAVLALALGVVLVTLAGALLVHRVLRARVGHRPRARAETARGLLADWVARAEAEPDAGPDARLADLVRALRPLPRREALRAVAEATTHRLSPNAAGALGAALRDEVWARRVLAGAAARGWRPRLDAACLLAVIGTPDDAPGMRVLLDDPHVAVRSAATLGLRSAAGAGLVADVVRALPAQPPTLRGLQMRELRGHAAGAEAALLACLAGALDAGALAAWAALAAVLQRPRAVAALVPYAVHAHDEARAAVARALGACPSPTAVRVLQACLGDPAPEVRRAAAHATARLGPLALRLAPALSACLADADGEVRLRAALALAQCGEPGRTALRAARALEDRVARDTALLVSGLSDGALLELAAT